MFKKELASAPLLYKSALRDREIEREGGGGGGVGGGDSSEFIRTNFRYAVKFSYHRAAKSLVMIV